MRENFTFTIIPHSVYNINMLKIIEITDKKEWDDFVNEHNGHPLQLWGWGELKSRVVKLESGASFFEER